MVRKDSNMKWWFCGSLIIALIAQTPASALYMEKYTDWKGASQEKKEGFVIGVMESMAVYTFESKEHISINRGISACRKSNPLLFNQGVIVSMIDAEYEAKEIFDDPPVVVLDSIITMGMCVKFVNKNRIELGLKPFPEK